MLTKFETQHFELKGVCHYFVALFFCFLFVTQPVLRFSFNIDSPANIKYVIDFMSHSIGAVFALGAWLTMYVLCAIRIVFKYYEYNKNFKFKKVGFKEVFVYNKKSDLLLDFSNPFLYSNKTETLRE